MPDDRVDRATYPDVEELVPLRGDVETNALPCAGQGDAPHKENEQDGEGERGGEVHDLAHGLDSVHNAQEHHDPGRHVAKQQLPNNGARHLDPVRYL